MIEKLKKKQTKFGYVSEESPLDMLDKINELVDAVNELQENQNTYWTDIAEIKKELLQTPAENVPGPIKLYVCADGSVYDNLDVAKSHAASIFNPLPAGATTTDRVYLEQELIRTRKALDVAVDALKGTHEYYEYCTTRLATGHKARWDWVALTMDEDILKAIEQITALEQKDVK